MPPEGYLERQEEERRSDYERFMKYFNDNLKNSIKVKDTLNIKEQIIQAEIDLQRAVESENYEEAAMQRDLLTELKEI